MLTQTENQAARKEAADFLTEATAYKAFLKSHDLPLSLDTTKLLDIYRGRLFEQLLAADTGLQARYDMARTKEGKERIKTDTMAGISLKGHELPEKLAEAIAELEAAYRTVPQINDVPHVALAQLVGYGLDYGRYLDRYTMNWEGKEHARAHFEQLAVTLTQWRNLVKAMNGPAHTLTDVMEYMTRPFSRQLPDKSPIKIDEKAMYQYLSHNPHLLEVLPKAA
jgi:aryl carrier-like protein